jgi:hypothetical protein
VDFYERKRLASKLIVDLNKKGCSLEQIQLGVFEAYQLSPSSTKKIHDLLFKTVV